MVCQELRLQAPGESCSPGWVRGRRAPDRSEWDGSWCGRLGGCRRQVFLWGLLKRRPTAVGTEIVGLPAILVMRCFRRYGDLMPATWEAGRHGGRTCLGRLARILRLSVARKTAECGEDHHGDDLPGFHLLNSFVVPHMQGWLVCMTCSSRHSSGRIPLAADAKTARERNRELCIVTVCRDGGPRRTRPLSADPHGEITKTDSGLIPHRDASCRIRPG